MSKKNIILIVFMMVTAVSLVSCKKEKKFTEPDFLLRKWANATETLNYNDYRRCEAYPKDPAVFREMYRDHYLTGVMITKIEDLDEEDVKKDHEDRKYISRKVYFTCTEVERYNRRPGNSIQGDVMFIRFLESARKNDGWLMSNRTLMKFDK